MDILLPQIQDFCRQKFQWVRRSDVTLIPNPNVIPEGVGFPFIGLKDGPVDYHHDTTGGVIPEDLVVELYIFDRLDRSAEDIIGLHAKVRDAVARLKGHLFPGGIIDATPLSQIPVVLLYTKKGLVIRKGLRIKYNREE